MDKFQKHNSFNGNTPSTESYRNHKQPCLTLPKLTPFSITRSKLA